MPEFTTAQRLRDYITDTWLNNSGGPFSLTAEDQVNAIMELTNSMYLRDQLRNSGQSQVHWDNITNVPNLAPRTAQVLTVNPFGTNPSPSHTREQALGSTTNTFNTIGSAIGVAQNNDIVVIDGGTYNEIVSIPAGLHTHFIFRNFAHLTGNIRYEGDADYTGLRILSDRTGKITGDIHIHSAVSDCIISGFNAIEGRFTRGGGVDLQGLSILHCGSLLNTEMQGVGGTVGYIDNITFNTLIPSNFNAPSFVNCKLVGGRFSNDSNRGFRTIGLVDNCHFSLTTGGFGSFGQITSSYRFKSSSFKTTSNYIFDLHPFSPGGNYIQLENCTFEAGVAVFNNKRSNTVLHKNCMGNVPMLSAAGTSSVIEISDSYLLNSNVKAL